MLVKEILSEDLFNCDTFDINLEIQFSPNDQCKIHEEKKSTYFLASAIISDSSWLWWRNMSHIKPGTLTDENNFLYYQHLITKDLFLYRTAIEKYNFGYYKNLADKLIMSDSENSYPYYLKAILIFLFTDNIEEALDEIRVGNEKQKYNDYRKQKFKIIRDTALFLNYPYFTACYYAHMNCSYNTSVPLELGKICRRVKNSSDRKECALAGSLIEKYGVFSVDKLLGLSIQTRSNIYPEDELKKRSKILREKSTEILNVEAYQYDINEKEYIELIENIYDLGEVAAYNLFFNK